MQVAPTPRPRSHRRFEHLHPLLLRHMRLLIILGVVAVLATAFALAFFAVSIALQALEGILTTLQAVLLTLEHGDVFLKAVLVALLLLVVIKRYQAEIKQYCTVLRRLLRRLPLFH